MCSRRGQISERGEWEKKRVKLDELLTKHLNDCIEGLTKEKDTTSETMSVYDKLHSGCAFM